MHSPETFEKHWYLAFGQKWCFSLFQNWRLSMNWFHNFQHSKTKCVVMSYIKTRTSKLYLINCISHFCFWCDTILVNEINCKMTYARPAKNAAHSKHVAGKSFLSCKNIVKAWHQIKNCTLKMFPNYNEIDTCSRWICVGQFGPASFLSCAGLTYAFLRC